MNVKKDILWRVYVSFLLVCALAGAVIFQIVRVQTVKGDYWKNMADSLTTAYVNIDPMRGNIYAADGSLLSTSIPIYEVRMDLHKSAIKKEDFENGVDSLAQCLSDYFKDKPASKYEEELRRARKRNSRYFLIKRKLTHTQLKDIKKFPILRLGRYKGGIIVEQKSRRILPFQMAQRTIGYKTPDVKPVGLEGAYDEYLAGKIGKRLMQKASGGVWIPINDENELEPKDGQDIITAIDVNFQDATQAALLKALVTHEAAYGCAIVMEVKTGHIKAISNLKRGATGDYIEEYNYALGASTEPGSTFKLATLMAILEHSNLTPNTMVDTKGGVTTFFDRVMKDSKEGGYGVVSLKKAFEVSSNVAISQAAVNAFSKEPSRFTNYIAALKLNQPLGLPIKGEGHPVFKTPRHKDWNGTTLPWMSIGYELRMTPLQMLTLYNSIANEGVMVKPQFVTEIREVGKLVQKFDTEVINPQVCSQKTLKNIQAMLEGVVEEGTATNIKNDMYKIAGKTGTAQVADDLRGYKAQRSYQASFAGYFPATKPMYSIIVMITNPSKGTYYGASVAAPVFKDIADKIYAMTASTRSYMALFNGNANNESLPLVPALQNEDLSALLSFSNIKAPSLEEKESWVTVAQNKNKIEAKNYNTSTNKVPDVNGMVLSDAIYILENAGYKVRFSGKGRVKMQIPEPGTALGPNQRVELLLNLENHASAKPNPVN